MPVIYRKFGRAMVAGDLIGSEMPGRNSRSSAVIMAYWPSRGNCLNDIDYSIMQVGVVQYFLWHKLCCGMPGSHKVESCVKWKRLHAHYDWFGASATVCEDIDTLEFINFVPIQRIACRCAYVTMPVNFTI